MGGMTSESATPVPFDLTGRVALVTGAGSAEAIGFACARCLGALGAAVMVTATTGRVHERAAELRDAGVHADATIADLTDPEAAAALVGANRDRRRRERDRGVQGRDVIRLLDVEQVAALVLPEPLSCVVVEHVVVPPQLDLGSVRHDDDDVTTKRARVNRQRSDQGTGRCCRVPA
jgi:NAD(P)-dependent dehydrogenase (short-subunit alcohol dehydrogenase family)